MKDILLVGEDALCCELGAKIVKTVLPAWTVSGRPINKKGITRLLPELPRYAECALHVRPVLCIADTDHKCPVHLKAQWLPADGPRNLLLRFAVSEAESWVLADRQAVSEFFDVPLKLVPTNPEQVEDAKMEILKIASRSRRQDLRAEMLSGGKQPSPGSGYNVHLCRLVAEVWEVRRAAQSAASLMRALQRIESLAQD